MTIQADIERKLNERFQPHILRVENESGMHSVPKGSESHFKVTLVSDEFVGQSLIARHRLVNALLSDELAGPIHALALHTMTPQEWTAKNGEVPDSPLCRGGSKASG